MNIVYLCQYFYPEIGAPATRVLEMSLEWVKMGHQVTVVTGFPNHPTGIIPKIYRGRMVMEENHQGIRVLRNFLYATPNQGFFKRTISHLSFMISSFVLSLPRLGKTDMIVVSSPAFFAVFSALAMSWFTRTPFIFEVRDLWPAAIAELGVIKFKPIISILESLELFLYHRAAKVVVVTESFRDNLIRRGIPASKIEVIFNGVDPERFGQVSGLTAKQAHQLDGKLVVLYTGAHGISHSLDNLILVASRLRNLTNISFLFVGEGAMKKSLQGMADKLKLENVAFWPGQPREKMPEIYALADLCIVSLRKVDLFTKVIPSKIFEIMASGRPMIASIAGEAAWILERSGSALVIPPEDPDSLEKAILELAGNEGLRQKMGKQGAQFVREHFNRVNLALQYEKVFESLRNHRVQVKMANQNRNRGIS
jgi:glycosyltransferase involved in cell wall biosynthesis